MVTKWESYPRKQDDEQDKIARNERLRHEIAIAFKRYNLGLKIAASAPKKETPKFKEFKKQPVSLKGGTLKDYQMDGLKYELT